MSVSSAILNDELEFNGTLAQPVSSARAKREVIEQDLQDAK